MLAELERRSRFGLRRSFAALDGVQKRRSIAALRGGCAAKLRARPPADCFLVSKADLAAQGSDLSLNRYKEVVRAAVAHRPPGEILAGLAELEKEIVLGMRELETKLEKPVRTK